MMVPMRAALRLLTVFSLALALLPGAVAQAEIAPVPKPTSGTTAPTNSGSASVNPLPKPQQPVEKKTVPPVTKTRAVQTQKQTRAVTPSAPPSTPERKTQKKVTPPTPAGSAGGREEPAVVTPPSTSGHAPSVSVVTNIVELMPTPLAIASDSLPATEAWPPWVLSLFTLLATAEAFLLVRIARARRFRRAELIALREH